MIYKYDEVPKFIDYAVDLYIDNINYDLHNEFEVKSIDYAFDKLILKLLFVRSNDETNILFTFYNAIIAKLLLFFPVDEATIDQLYRGEPMSLELDNLKNSQNKGYFYFSFLPEFNLEILADSFSIEKNSEFCNINNGVFSVYK